MKPHEEEAAPAESREFERYVLLAALTLLVLCLLWMDRSADSDRTAQADTDRVLRVEIGDRTGALATRTPVAGRTSDERRVTELESRRVPPPLDRTADRPRPDPIVPGPVDPEPGPSPPAKRPERLYKVRPDDTLSGIASRELGRAGRAMEIARLNGISDPRRLRAGVTIKLPQK